MKNLLLFLLLLLVSQSLVGQRQSYSGYMEAGDAAVAQNDYFSAYHYYQIAGEYAGKENEPDMLYKLGESALNIRAYRVSQAALLKLATLPEAASYPLNKFHLGTAYFHLGEYDQAVAYYEQFLEEQPNAEAKLRGIAGRNIRDANWALDNPAPEGGIPEHMGLAVNSEYSDVAYTISPDGKKYITSNRYRFKKDTLNPRRKLSRVVEIGGIDQATEKSATLVFDDKLVAHAAFTPDNKQVYYSVCTYISHDEVRCQLYLADVDEAGKWVNGQPLSSLNGENFSTQMPNIGQHSDGSSYLYFSSNRPGGKGGFDIYRAPFRADGSLGQAMNVEALNTSSDDVTPFFYEPLQLLYFATNGRYSYGGLDIYKAFLIDNKFKTPINLGAGVNSSFDDAYYTRFEQGDKAYLSSTRQSPEAIFFDNEQEVCCYDIYSLTPDDRIELLVTTFNGLTQEELIGATVTLYEITPTGPVAIEKLDNPTANDFNFKVEPGKKYELRGEKDGFSIAYDTFDLNDPELGGLPVVERQLYLNPTINLEVFTFNNNDQQPLPGATVALYRVGENGEEELLEIRTNPVGNDFNYPVEIGSLYRVKGTHPNFGEAIDEVDLRNFKGDASQTIRRDLYLGQLLEILVVDGVTDEPLTNATVQLAKVGGTSLGTKTNPTGNDFLYVVNLDEYFVAYTTREGYRPSRDTFTFTAADLAATAGKLRFIVPLYPADPCKLLPSEVFFDNDYPNPRTTNRTTNLTYEATYYPYYDRRETFIDNFTEGMDREDAFETQIRFRNFFDRQVEGGWKQLEALAGALEGYLMAGNSISLKIQGYASPRATTDYNFRLSQRRIASVINYLERQNNGALKTYIQNGQLEFARDPKGETADPAVVSDRLDDPRLSVFSILASLERRVRIESLGDTCNDQQ